MRYLRRWAVILQNGLWFYRKQPPQHRPLGRWSHGICLGGFLAALTERQAASRWFARPTFSQRFLLSCGTRRERLAAQFSKVSAIDR